MSALSINKNNFSEVMKSEKTVLLDFFAPWCAPCRTLSPIVDKIAEENPQFTVGKINIDEEKELATQFGVRSVPALFVMKDGKVVNSSLGVISKQKILQLLV